MVHSFTEIKTLFKNYLEQNLFNEDPKGLYESINYLLQLGGKRVRPGLALMAANLYGDIDENAYKVAMAIEVFHNFTLMSDDIIDEASLRRGKETVHTKYGLNTAVLSGDAMMIEAINWLIKIDRDDILPFMVRRFTKYAMDVCYGQQYDINFETQKDVTIDEYIEMIRLKTAVLLGCSLSLGAKVAGGSDEDLEHLQLFGENIGIAFQLQDDFLDTFGEQAKVGKRIGGDILQNKKTYLYLKSLEIVDNKDKQRLIDLFDDKINIGEQEKIDEVTNIFNSVGIQEYAIQLMEAYHHLGMSHLESIDVAPERKKALIEIAEFLLNRKH